MMPGDFLNTFTPASRNSKFIQSIKNWRAKLSPVLGVGILGLFLYWTWVYRDIIIDTFGKLGFAQLVVLIVLIVISGILTACALVILVQDKGYTF